MDFYDKLLVMKIVGFNLKNSTASKESILLAINTSINFRHFIFSQEQTKFIETKKTLETKCDQKFQGISTTILNPQGFLFTVSILSAPFIITGETEATIDLPNCTSLLINFPATHGLKAISITSPWLSIHAALVSLSAGYAILRFTIFPGSHRKISSQGKTILEILFRMALGLSLAPKDHRDLNNRSHSKCMHSESQRLNYPGTALPPGLQLILHSTFVITGAIPPINIIRSLEQSGLEMHFLFIWNLSAARGTKSIILPMTRMDFDFSPVPPGLFKQVHIVNSP